MRAVVDGKLPEGVTGKDIILAIIGEIGTAGGIRLCLEYAGEAIRSLSIGRMTLHCHAASDARTLRNPNAGAAAVPISAG